MLNVLNEILNLDCVPVFVGTLCFKSDGNNNNSPAVQGNINDSEFKLLYFLGSSFIAACTDLANCIGGNVLSCLK